MRDDVMTLAAALAFRGFLALFPFGIFVAALGSEIARALNIDNPARQAVQALGSVLPSEAAIMIEAVLQQTIESSSTTLLSAGVILALIFAAGGADAVIKAMNRAYDVPEARPFWRRYLVALTMSLIGGIGVITAFLLLVPLRLLGPQVATLLGLGELGGPMVAIIASIGAVLLVIVAVAIVYRVAPNIKLPIRSVLPGSVLFAFSWLVAALGFGFYVSNFGTYANTYGALAGVALLLLFFYISAILLLVAAEINAVLHQMAAPEDVADRQDESEDRKERSKEGERTTSGAARSSAGTG